MNNKNNIVTCSFTMDRDVYNAYKSIVVRNGESVKGNLISYMKNVIEYGISNAETIIAIEEVKQLKSNPDKKTYNSFAEIIEEINNEQI